MSRQSGLVVHMTATGMMRTNVFRRYAKTFLPGISALPKVSFRKILVMQKGFPAGVPGISLDLTKRWEI